MPVFVCNGHYWCNVVDLLFAADIGNVPTGPASEDVDDDDVPGRCYLRMWLRKMETVSNTYTLPFTINTIHRGVHWSLLTRDILYTNKLAKPLFFFTYSRLRHHCCNLAEGSCLLMQFHFTLCHYFLGHVACRIWPGRGLDTQAISFGLKKVRAIVLSEKRERAGLFQVLLFFYHRTCTSTSRSDIKLICLFAHVSQN